jgi:hypothetical protein
MKLILLALMFIVPSCSQMPVTQDDDQCSPILKTAMDTNGVEWISMSESYCFCRKYRFSIDYIGKVPDTESWKEPIMSCNKVVGFKPAGYARKASYWEAVRQKIKAQIGDGK